MLYKQISVSSGKCGQELLGRGDGLCAWTAGTLVCQKLHCCCDFFFFFASFCQLCSKILGSGLQGGPCRGFQGCIGKAPFKIRCLLNKAWQCMVKNEVVGGAKRWYCRLVRMQRLPVPLHKMAYLNRCFLCALNFHSVRVRSESTTQFLHLVTLM